MKRIFLARHGESEANRQKVISGQTDAPLSEKGRNQAQWLCDVLKHEQLAAIYATGLSRTMETARPVADYCGIDIQVVDQFMEIDLGALQGSAVIENLKSAQALRDGRDNAKKAYASPEGENLDEFKSRVIGCLEAVLAQLEGAALIVGHRNTNEVILRYLLGPSLDGDNVINIKNKYLYEIRLDGSPEINTIRLGGESHGKKFAGLKDD